MGGGASAKRTSFVNSLITDSRSTRIEKDYLQDLLRKREVFAQETGTSKALHITMSTPGGVAHNSCWHSIAAEITAEDLFS